MNIQEATDKVVRSVMRRIDYLALERSLIDVLGTVRGCHLAEVIVRDVLVGLAEGKDLACVSGALVSRAGNATLVVAVNDACREISSSCGIEIGSLKRIGDAERSGEDVNDVFLAVSEGLIPPGEPPTVEQQAEINRRCFAPIVASAKASIPGIADYCQKERMICAAGSEQTIDGLIGMAVVMLAQPDATDIETIEQVLQGALENDDERPWLGELLADCKQFAVKEIAAVNSLNIGWARQMSIDELEEAVRFRLEH